MSTLCCGKLCGMVQLFRQITCIAAAALLAGCASTITARLGPDKCAAGMAEVLERINAVRAAGQRCGARVMAPAPALRWDRQLYSAAAGHSADMARRNYIEHLSPEGVHVSHRVDASHYKWKSVGENLAAGDLTIDGAVQGWVASPQHCENLMEPKYVDVAVACSARAGTDLGTYWTMVLARK